MYHNIHRNTIIKLLFRRSIFYIFVFLFYTSDRARERIAVFLTDDCFRKRGSEYFYVGLLSGTQFLIFSFSVTFLYNDFRQFLWNHSTFAGFKFFEKKVKKRLRQIISLIRFELLNWNFFLAYSSSYSYWVWCLNVLKASRVTFETAQLSIFLLLTKNSYKLVSNIQFNTYELIQVLKTVGSFNLLCIFLLGGFYWNKLMSFHSILIQSSIFHLISISIHFTFYWVIFYFFSTQLLCLKFWKEEN